MTPTLSICHLIVLASLVLTLPVQAQLSGSDAFTDNSKDPAKWGADVLTGGASFMETNSRLEYRVTTPDGDFDEALRPWILNSARNSDAFDVILDVFNNLSPGDSNNASIGLVVTNLENSEDSIYVELFRGGPSSDGKGFLAALSSAAAGGEVLPYTTPTSHAAVTTASVRLSYNPSTLIFTAYYDANGSADGFQWESYGSFGVGASGGGTIRNSPWQLTQNLGFKVSVSAFSEGLVVASGSVYADNFSINPPTVTAITPSSGPTAGGTSVTITGTNFTGATGVTIGGAAATSVSVVNATTITATTPAGIPGTASVVVITPGGSNSANSLFTYVAPPASVSVLGLTKTRHHDQTAAGTTALHDYSMQGFLEGPSHSASIPSSSNRFTRSGGGPYALIFDDGRWEYRSFFSSKALLDAEFPNTTYDFLIGTSPAVFLPFGTENYPVQPVITASAGTWSGGRLLISEAEALAGFTLTSNTSNGTGFLSLEVYSNLEDILYEVITSNPGLNESISGTVPPGSLSMGQVYEVNAEFDHGSPGVSLAGQSWALPGAQGYTLFSSNTRFEMEVVAAPTVTAISPTSGSTAGGTSVTITGTNFTGATSVTIGGAAATSVSVINATTITCLTPAGTAGAKSVVVTTPGGSNSANSLFTYVAPAPTVTAITPSSGPTTGGTSVTIAGTNFTGATSVTIGGAAAISVSVVNATTITCVTPAGTAGAKSVVVTTSGGSNSANSLFTYVAAPTVTSIAPTSGPTTGGTSVTITGTNFAGATGVTIGGAAATGITVVNATTITATTPAGTAGAKSVVVTTPSGSNSANSLFTYVAAPTVTAISPSKNPLAGGVRVTITGTNFTGATGVTVGGAAATNVNVVNDTTIYATTPSGTAGTASVVVTTPSGSNSANSLLTYVAAPTVTSIAPVSGPTAGGTSVTITGTNFTWVLGVTIGGVAATSVTEVNPTTITATTPAGTAGTTSVVVNTAFGSSSANSLFTYVAPAPTVTAIAPTSGPTTGGTSVTITGTNFTGATGVTIGGAAATSVSVVNATTITCVTPSGTAGAKSVVVTTPGGSNSANSLFTYVAAPTVTSVAPASGPVAGGTSVTITGTNFTGATGVTIGGAAATSVSVVNSTTITCVTPAGMAGAKSVVVTSPFGSNNANSLFTYVAAPATNPPWPGASEFGTGGIASVEPSGDHKMASLPNGGIILAKVNPLGPFSPPTGAEIVMVRLKPDGSPDSDFQAGPGSYGFPGEIHTPVPGAASVAAVAVDGDGKILVAGTADGGGPPGFAGAFLLARFHADGSLDGSFDGDGIVVADISAYNDSVVDMMIQPDSKILLLGVTDDPNPFVSRKVAAVVRFDSTGALDPLFAFAGVQTTGLEAALTGETMPRAMLRQSDGSVVITGHHAGLGLQQVFMVRFGPNGDTDPIFTRLVDFGTGSHWVGDLAIQADDKIVLVGGHGADEESASGIVLRLDSSGEPDSTFGGGMGVVELPPTMHGPSAQMNTDENGRLLITARHTTSATLPSYPYSYQPLYFLRLSPEGIQDTSFGDTGSGAPPGGLVVSPAEFGDLGSLLDTAAVLPSALLALARTGTPAAPVGTSVLRLSLGSTTSTPPAWAGSDNFNDNIRHSGKWAAPDAVVGNAQLIEINGRLEYRVASPDGNYDEALRHWQATIPTNNEPFEAMVDVHNGVTGNNASIGLTITSLQDGRDNLYVELYRVGPDGSGFLAALRSNVHGGDEVPPYTLPSGHGTTDGTVRVVWNPTSQIFTTYYDPTGSSDGYQWQMYGSFGVGVSGGGDTRNSPWLLANNAGFKISISGFSEGLAIPSGQVFADNFRIQPPASAPTQQFQSWAAAFGLAGEDSDFAAEPFADGVPNLLKYAFNMNASGPDVDTMLPGGSSGLPAIAPQSGGPSGIFRFDFLRRIGSGLIYTPQKTSSLQDGSWGNVTDVPTVVPLTAEWERVVYEEPYNPALTPRLFGRVLVTLP